jgi:tetratricopeptide (TPR) repeat protein
MGQDFKDKEEGRNSVQQFEEMLKNGETVFLDIETYETIIGQYMEEGKYSKALTACNFALEQYPYSTELMLDKAQLLANTQKFEEALELLDRASLFNP